MSKPRTKGTLDFRGKAENADPTPAAPATKQHSKLGVGAEPIHPIYVRQSVYKLFKVHCTMTGQQMTTRMDEILSEYLERNGIIVPPRPDRVNAKKSEP